MARLRGSPFQGHAAPASEGWWASEAKQAAAAAQEGEDGRDHSHQVTARQNHPPFIKP